MKQIVLEPLAIEAEGNDYVRRCRIIRVDGDSQVDTRELWFQFSKTISPPDDNDCDSYLLATVMDAMTEGREILIKGSVSLGLLSNLIEYQSAWNKWLPETYSIIDIKVESARENEQPVSGAVCAFSGGIDSIFSVWRNSQGKNGYRSQNIKLCSLIHGFDIPLHNTTAFASVTQRAVTTLNDVGIKLMPIKTNYREISSANWGYAHGTALVAALSNFKNVAGTCIIGSSYPYNHLLIPWGSTPVIDFLLSSDDFSVIHDGASHSRIEKVYEISEWKIAIENLRVCWESDSTDQNCGKCEKCVRTKLNFLVTGKLAPRCLDVDDGEEIDFKNIVLGHAGTRGAWQDIVDYADEHGVKAAWVTEAKKVLKRKSLTYFIAPKGSSRRAVAKRIIKTTRWR